MRLIVKDLTCVCSPVKFAELGSESSKKSRLRAMRVDERVGEMTYK
jgi:hypothetical protein